MSAGVVLHRMPDSDSRWFSAFGHDYEVTKRPWRWYKQTAVSWEVTRLVPDWRERPSDRWAADGDDPLVGHYETLTSLRKRLAQAG